MADHDLARYARQTRFAPLGEEGQRRLLKSRALVCGCGALGTHLADTLARAGVGRLRIVDRDFVETTNLQRQVLFDEEDAAEPLPKAVAAARKLRRINSQIEIDERVMDVDHRNLEELCQGVDVIVDGTDNFETRYLLNDASLKWGIPWVYAGCLGAEGQTMTILPGETPCLACLLPEPPRPGESPTCDTAGIVAPIIGVMASIQAMEAIKILSGRSDAVQRGLIVIDLWENRLRQVKLGGLRESSDCSACGRRQFSWLNGERASQAAVLCGRNAVQLRPSSQGALALDELARKLAPVARVSRNAWLLRAEVEGYRITVFPDGRAIVGGTDDPAVARTVYSRYVGA